MSSITLNPGGLAVVSMRVLFPFRGVWVADLELSPDNLALAPSSGPVTLSIAPGGAVGPPTATLQGTIDPRGTGQFVEFYRVRVLGGGAGWDQAVAPQHYHSDGGLFAQDVLGAIAVAGGEKLTTPVPVALGIDFMTAAGPRSRVFDAPVLAGLDWWVDPSTGVTMLGTRPPAVADPTLELMSWNPAEQVAELVCQGVILPGTILSDPRIPGGPVVVRDVEQLFDAHGSHAKAWCGTSAVSQMMNDLRALVVEYSGRRFLATYEYRLVVQNGDGRLELQAVNASDGVPDTLPLTPWSGLQGASAKLRPGSIVRIAFLHGDPSQPIVDSYAPDTPLEATVDASVALHVGPSAASVDVGKSGAVALAGGAGPLIPSSWAIDPAKGLLFALGQLATKLGTATTIADVVAAGGALSTALGELPPSATTRTTAT